MSYIGIATVRIKRSLYAVIAIHTAIYRCSISDLIIILLTFASVQEISTCTYVIVPLSISVYFMLWIHMKFDNMHVLNQARAGRRPARAWFLKITSVRMYVCVSAPEAMNN